jgi:cell wall-associated NlpC family hydrolase
MRLVTRSVIAVAAAATLGFVGVVPVEASSSGDVKQQIEQIADEIERLEAKVDQFAEDYAVAVDNKATLDAEVIDAEARVAAKQAEVDAVNADLSNMAVEAFVGGGGGGTITTLLSGGAGPNDAVQREQFSDVAYNSGAETTNDYEQLVRELEAEQADLEDKRDQAAELAEQIAASQTNAEQSIQDLNEKRSDAESRYGELLAAEQRAREEAAQREAQEQIARAQAAAAAAAARPASPGTSGSDGGGRGGGGADSGASTTADDAPSSGGGGGGGSSSSDDGGSSSSGGTDPNAGAGGGSSLGAIAVSAAMAQRGVPYRFAASQPGVAFDCSGLTAYAWGQAGVSLPHQSRAQYASTPRVSMANLAPGDLIFYYSPISHVSLYIGGGQVVHAPATGDVVKVSGLSGNAIGATRPG